VIHEKEQILLNRSAVSSVITLHSFHDRKQ